MYQSTIKKPIKTHIIVPVYKLTGFLNANFDEKKIKQLFTTDKILTIQRKNYRAIRMCNDNRVTKRRFILHMYRYITLVYVMKQPRRHIYLCNTVQTFSRLFVHSNDMTLPTATRKQTAFQYTVQYSKHCSQYLIMPIMSPKSQSPRVYACCLRAEYNMATRGPGSSVQSAAPQQLEAGGREQTGSAAMRPFLSVPNFRPCPNSTLPAQLHFSKPLRTFFTTPRDCSCAERNS